MPFSFADLGPLSETAASYLGSMPVDANDVLTGNCAGVGPRMTWWSHRWQSSALEPTDAH